MCLYDFVLKSERFARSFCRKWCIILRGVSEGRFHQVSIFARSGVTPTFASGRHLGPAPAASVALRHAPWVIVMYTIHYLAGRKCTPSNYIVFFFIWALHGYSGGQGRHLIHMGLLIHGYLQHFEKFYKLYPWETCVFFA